MEPYPMPKYGESDAVKTVKMIAEQLTTRERAMLQAWILARLDVRGYDLPTAVNVLLRAQS